MINEKDVAKVAELARMKLNENEIKMYATQLSSILDAFEKLSKVDTAGVEPMVTPIDITQPMRDDEREEHFSVDELMKSAPDRAGNLYRVPPVV